MREGGSGLEGKLEELVEGQRAGIIIPALWWRGCNSKLHYYEKDWLLGCPQGAHIRLVVLYVLPALPCCNIWTKFSL
jgi:hypothetical protein